MTEATFWRGVVRPALTPFGMVRRIENRLEAGMPDTLYCIDGVTGLIELKHAYQWPARPTTQLRFNHFGIEQVSWLENWQRCGGRCFVLAQVQRTYLLFRGSDARLIGQGMTRRHMEAQSLVFDRGRFPQADVVRHLVKPF